MPSIEIPAEMLVEGAGTYLVEVEDVQVRKLTYLHCSLTAEVPFDVSAERVEELGVYIGRRGEGTSPWRLRIGDLFMFDGFEPPPEEQRYQMERLLGWKWTELEEN